MRTKSLALLFLIVVTQSSSVYGVRVSEERLGQALIFPYFSVADGVSTWLTVTNFRGDIKALKLRVLDGRTGIPVIFLNLYLSYSDTWTGVLRKDSDTGKLELITRDSTCTSAYSGLSSQTIASIATLTLAMLK